MEVTFNFTPLPNHWSLLSTGEEEGSSRDSSVHASNPHSSPTAAEALLINDFRICSATVINPLMPPLLTPGVGQKPMSRPHSLRPHTSPAPAQTLWSTAVCRPQTVAEEESVDHCPLRSPPQSPVTICPVESWTFQHLLLLPLSMNKLPVKNLPLFVCPPEDHRHPPSGCTWTESDAQRHSCHPVN